MKYNVFFHSNSSEVRDPFNFHQRLITDFLNWIVNLEFKFI